MVQILDRPIPTYSETISESGFTIVHMPDGRDVVINRFLMVKHLGVALSHISKIFQGQRTPSLYMASRIARFMGISIEDLMWVIEERPKYLANR